MQDLPLGGVLKSESEDLVLFKGPPAGPVTFIGDVELRAFGPGGEDGARVSSGTGEL